jgi:CRISPR-associated protein Csx3
MSNLQLQLIELETGEPCQTLAINLRQPKDLIQTQELPQLLLPPELDWQRGIILFGSVPLWLYSNLVLHCRKAPWVATYDIRLKVGVVVASRVSRWQPGDTIPIHHSQVPGAAILIGGPPNSGKSVLSNALRVSLRERQQKYRVYLHRANWDGEGSHTYETQDRSLARQLKAENKVKISPNLIEEYFKYQAIATKNIRQVVDLAIVDVGGIPAWVKRPVVEQCSHYILISHDLKQVEAWHELCEGLKPMAVIHSVWEDKLEVIGTEPFLEIVAGKWEPSCVVPEVLLDAVFEVFQERLNAFINSSFCRVN